MDARVDKGCGIRARRSLEQTFDLVLAKQGDLFDGWQHPRWERLEDVLDEKSQVTEGGGNGSLGLVAGCQRGPPDLTAVTCAPITRVIRGIASEVEIGPEQGLPDRGVINCDNVITIPKTALEPSPVGFSTQGKRAELDRTLRYSLDVIY